MDPDGNLGDCWLRNIITPIFIVNVFLGKSVRKLLMYMDGILLDNQNENSCNYWIMRMHKVIM